MSNAILPALVLVFLILLFLTVPRTYFQYIQPRLKGFLENYRLRKMLSGDVKLLRRVGTQQCIFKAAPQFPHLAPAVQKLLLSNISYHVVAREGDHWDLGQTVTFIEDVSRDPNLEMVAEAALNGETLEEIIHRVGNVKKED